MNNLILTFDYELPLGGVKIDYRDALFEPTNQLLDWAETWNLSLVFFVDILCYVQCQKLQIDSFTTPFKKQVQEMIQRGHDVQLHIHPHWLNTKIHNNHFETDAPFSLSDYKDEEIDHIISLAVKELTQLAQEIDPNYQCLAFRAGGYNFGPKMELICRFLYQQGIRFDSSIAKGYYFKSDTSDVDYRNFRPMPNGFIPFSKISTSSIHRLFEIPIASRPKSLFEIPTFIRAKWFAHRSVNRGIMIHTINKLTFLEKLRKLFSSRMLTVDNHTFSHSYLYSILDYHIGKYQKYSDISCALIGHPKAMGTYSLELLTQLVQTIQKESQQNITITNFTQLYKQNIYKI